MSSRVSVSKFWLLLFLHAVVLSDLQSCSAKAQVFPGLEWLTYPKWLYLHNETRVAMAEAKLGQGSGTGAFMDFDAPVEDGCQWYTVAPRLSFAGARLWVNGSHRYGLDEVQVLAVDSCSKDRFIFIGRQTFEFCSQEWASPKPGPLQQRRFFKVLVMIRTQELKVLAEGVYGLHTGEMHLVGCTGWGNENSTLHEDVPPVVGRLAELSRPLVVGAYVSTTSNESSWPLLNETSPKDCAVTATLHYPPLRTRLISERVVRYSIRSARDEGDPLYFAPIERSMYFSHKLPLRKDTAHTVHAQRRLETWGRSLILVLGLVCVALQIEHGRSNEESLPFVSLTMLAIQLAHHLAQTSLFKDLQIRGPGFLQLYGEFIDDYGTMMWGEFVPYQAMTMTALSMYVWIFHRVGDRRRIMELRVRRGKPGAKDPPSDWRVMFSTVAVFVSVGIPGLLAAGGDHYSDQALPLYSDQLYLPFVPSGFYESRQAQWGFVNNFTGLVVSLFLVPQLLGNMQWELRGRPLSAWFYAGLPFLQSFPHFLSIARHFQLLPIFPFYDPYMNSFFGVFEDPDPWWEVGIVFCSVLQVLAVHYQFAKAQRQASTAPIVRI